MWLHNRKLYAMIFDGRGRAMRKNDWILAGCILLAAAALMVFCLQRSRQGGTVVGSVNGEIYGSYSLSDDRTVQINNSNRLIIENKTAKMEWADCPDQVCVRHREISRDGESIICLPNQVVVTVQSEESPELDGIAQ